MNIFTKRTWIEIIGAVVLIAAAGAAFYGGYVYRGVTNVAVRTPPPGTPYTSSVSGTVTSASATSLTIALLSGGSKTFAISSSTALRATVAAGEAAPAFADLAPGLPVIVVFNTAADGSVSVQSVFVGGPLGQ